MPGMEPCDGLDVPCDSCADCASTTGTRCPGIAASKTVTTNTAATNIPVCAATLRTSLPADISFFSQLFLQFPNLWLNSTYLSMIRSGKAGCFGAFVRKCIRENCPRVQGLKSRKYSAFSSSSKKG